jgi:hypothetical protein
MKKFTIPYLESLNSADMASAAGILEASGSPDIIDTVNWPKQYNYRPITNFYLARSNQSIFIKFNVRGNVLKAVYSLDQKSVHEDSCVEFFCKLPENNYYTNFEFNCIGTCSASKRKGRYDDVVMFDTDEMQTIKRLPSIARKAFKELSGYFEWDLTVEIPFALIGIDPENLPEKLFANFYKCADDTDSPHFVSWSPVKTENPDFHRPEFFGELLF